MNSLLTKKMNFFLHAVLVLCLDYCLGATKVINPGATDLKVVDLHADSKEVEDRSVWRDIMLATKMTSALERRDILDTLILGIEVGEDVPGLPTWLQKCMKMWERTLKFVQPVFYGVFPKTKPPGAKAMKLPFKLPLVHINVGTIYKIVKHCINVILYPPLLVSDIRNSPKELVKAGKYIMRGEKKLMKVIPKSLPKILHWLEDFPKKLSNGTIKVPFFLRHILQHGQSKKSLKSKRSKKRYNLNFDYMNMLGKVLQHPHMGDEPPEKRNKQLKKIVKSSET